MGFLSKKTHLNEFVMLDICLQNVSVNRPDVYII